jgi:hypothetical protein
MTNEERKNILDQHKDLYDGYVTRYNQSNEQPLYVQDFANDKAGITVNNRGEVGEYRNIRINEMRFDGKSTGLFDEDAHISSELTPSETFESDEIEEQMDMIGDGEDDLEHGTFGHKEFELNLDDLEDLDEEEMSSLTESVNKSLDMFRRFKNY